MQHRTLWHEPKATLTLINGMSQQCYDLESEDGLTPLIHRFGDRKVVMLGEASHGTAEFYQWRNEITGRLIREKGFRFVAVEGDWPDCYAINRFVKGHTPAAPDAAQLLRQNFQRWPTWMWSNTAIADFADWLRAHNDDHSSDDKVGFFGLDIYSLWDSLSALSQSLSAEKDALATLNDVIYCFEPYRQDIHRYARIGNLPPFSCREHAKTLHCLLQGRLDAVSGEDQKWQAFQDAQNSRVIANAEAYYRTMLLSGANSWNLRDRHMMETLERLLATHGPTAKAVVWAHNTHIGDARYTDMVDANEINIGQLARQKFGEANIALIGFASNSGHLMAGRDWGAPMESIQLPPAREGSWESILHRAKPENALYIFADMQLHADMFKPRGHRAVGVVYRPEYEQYGNYVPTILPWRYDALVYIDESTSLTPLDERPGTTESETSDTFPSAM
jgi:erythromycin esterase-like protein